MMFSKDAAPTNGLMEENTPEIGLITRCTEKVFSHGKTAETILVLTKMTSNMALVCSLGLMDKSTVANGKMENKMA